MISTCDLTLALALAAGTVLIACGSSTEVLEGEGGGGGETPPGAGPGGPGPGPGDGGAGVGGDGPNCTSNQQCIDDNGGLPYVCADGACASLLSAECTQILGTVDALADEDVVVIGVMAPLSGPDAAVGLQQVAAVSLARTELEQVVGGIPLEGTPAPTVAPVVAVVCDEVPSPVAAATHLVDGVGVSMIVGPSGSDAVATASVEVTIPTGTLLLSPSADGPELHLLDDAGLTWQAASVARHGEAMASVVARLEGELPAGEHRLAIVVEADDPRMAAVADAFVAAVTLNGESAADSAASGTLIRLEVSPGDPSAAAAEVVQLDADLVVVAAEGGFAAFAEAVESAATPIWVAGPRPDDVDEAASSIGDRLLVVQTGAPLDRAALDPFAIRFAGATGEVPSFAASEAYDHAYLGLLALAAVGSRDARGPDLAASLPRLIGAGAPTPVGPADLPAAFATLAAGGGIDLVGTTGSLDADGATGTSPRSHEVLCVSAGELSASGLVAGEDGQLGGTATCL